MHGAGNDFIITDNREGQNAKGQNQIAELARRICQRHYGVGADGFLCVENSNSADVKMSYYNADGSVATMCGNGLRCFAKFISDKGIVKSKSFRVETGDGLKQVEIKIADAECSMISVNMGIWDGRASVVMVTAFDKLFEAVFLHLGVPHAVIFLDQKSLKPKEFSQEFVRKYGPIIEKNPQFTEGTNVNFVEIIDRKHEKASTWERGAGSTLACGTGACAAAVVSNRLKGLSPKIEVIMPGGSLWISVMNNNEIFLEGPAQLICKGIF